VTRARFEEIGTERDHEQVGAADVGQDRVPPRLTTRELLVDPHVVARAAHVLQQQIDRLAVTTRIADEDLHHPSVHRLERG